MFFKRSDKFDSLKPLADGVHHTSFALFEEEVKPLLGCGDTDAARRVYRASFPPINRDEYLEDLNNGIEMRDKFKGLAGNCFVALFIFALGCLAGGDLLLRIGIDGKTFFWLFLVSAIITLIGFYYQRFDLQDLKMIKDFVENKTPEPGR